MDGERPDRPQGPGLTDSVWDMTRACWRHDPARRPTVSKVVGILREWPVSFFFEGTTIMTYFHSLQLQAMCHGPTLIQFKSTPAGGEGGRDERCWLQWVPAFYCSLFVIPMAHTSNHPTVLMPLGFPGAARRINQISDVPPLAVHPLRSDRFLQGTHEKKGGAEGATL